MQRAIEIGSSLRCPLALSSLPKPGRAFCCRPLFPEPQPRSLFSVWWPEGIGGDHGIPKKQLDEQCQASSLSRGMLGLVPPPLSLFPPGTSSLPRGSPARARTWRQRRVNLKSLFARTQTAAIPSSQNEKTQCVQSHSHGLKSAGQRPQRKTEAVRNHREVPALCTAKCQLEYSQHSNVLQQVASE